MAGALFYDILTFIERHGCIVFIGIIGLSLGSFLGCMRYRIPQKIPVLNRERSFCPVCKTSLRWFELIPIVSFIIQRGRCRHCSSRISWYYPIIELVTFALCLGVASLILY